MDYGSVRGGREEWGDLNGLLSSPSIKGGGFGILSFVATVVGVFRLFSLREEALPDDVFITNKEACFESGAGGSGCLAETHEDKTNTRILN